jgi:hypothetical protein
MENKGMPDCNVCKWLENSEFVQDYFKQLGLDVNHTCVKFKKRVLHFDIHPKLTPCPECAGKRFKEI